jgi:SAM-dependent methyltransferase
MKSMAPDEWTTADHVYRYLGRADDCPRRAEGESALLEHVPRNVRRVLDLGTGDGRLLALLQVDRNEMVGIGLDFSELMLEAASRRFADDERVELVKHDLSSRATPRRRLPGRGAFHARAGQLWPRRWRPGIGRPYRRRRGACLSAAGHRRALTRSTNGLRAAHTC